jgi:hypothetical protein
LHPLSRAVAHRNTDPPSADSRPPEHPQIQLLKHHRYAPSRAEGVSPARKTGLTPTHTAKCRDATRRSRLRHCKPGGTTEQSCGATAPLRCQRSNSVLHHPSLFAAGILGSRRLSTVLQQTVFEPPSLTFAKALDFLVEVTRSFTTPQMRRHLHIASSTGFSLCPSPIPSPQRLPGGISAHGTGI